MNLRIDTVSHQQFLDHALSVKRRFLAMYKAANAGHIGCSLSCAEIMTFLKFAWMQPDDTFILSKGHAAAALYSALAEEGVLSEADIASYYGNGTLLAAHPPARSVKQIPFATGSLGHGLSLAAGLALASKLKREQQRVFCLTSDGELDEGSTWEAVMFIAHHRLANIVWCIDRNKIQGIGRTEDVMRLEPLRGKLESFGFYVIEADGHDFISLSAAREEVERIRTTDSTGMPCALICHTTKGNSVAFMENTVDWHYLPMNDDHYARAQADVEAFYTMQKTIIAEKAPAKKAVGAL
jgi:transketolase